MQEHRRGITWVRNPIIPGANIVIHVCTRRRVREDRVCVCGWRWWWTITFSSGSPTTDAEVHGRTASRRVLMLIVTALNRIWHVQFRRLKISINKLGVPVSCLL